MNNLYGKNVLVTGASRGIGLAVAEALAKAGCQVTAVSRSCAERVVEYAADPQNINGSGTSGAISFKPMDVTNYDSVAEVVSSMDRIDIAVLCAGMGVAGSAEELPMELARAQMETNYFGVLQVGNLVLPKMRAQGKGLFIVVGSIAGKVPIPMQSHYSSSKYALEAYVEAINMEMRGFGVHAVIVEPGDTKTGFTGARKTYIDEASPYAEAVKKSVARMEHDEQNGRDPSSVAAVVMKLIGRKNPPVRVAVGFEYKALMFLLRFLPDRLKQFVLRKMYLPVQPK